MVVFPTSSRIGLTIDTGQWLTIPIPIDNKLCHFCSYNMVEIEAHFCVALDSPLDPHRR